ncbi:Na/Pi cotransporter family protein [Endothiovibrio diazotrophicus]
MKKTINNMKVPLTAVLLITLAASSVAMATDPEGVPTLPWKDMAMGLFGGLAIFLFGMEMMAQALKAVSGNRLRAILAQLTGNRFMGVVTGAGVTAVIQSSSVTTVLVIGFISANLMTLSQAVGVIMGANIGTTVTAQIVAFKVTKYALLMIAAGFGMQFFAKREKLIYYGEMLMGLGLIFLGMTLMGDAMSPLRDYPPFLDLMREMENPWLGIVVAALFTALIQSSSATTGIVIVMASQGFITLPAGIALAFGADIGTCVTALLASIGKPREAVRAGVVHMLFNIVGVLVWVGFIDQLAALAAWISPTVAAASEMGRMAAETPRQIANANTLFKVLNTLLFIGFTSQIVRLVRRLVPDGTGGIEHEVRPKYLSELLLETPTMALEAVRHEVDRMGHRVERMMHRILPALLGGDRRELESIAKMDNEVDILHGHVIRYLGEVSKTELSDEQTAELISLMEAVNDLENIGDVIETNLVAQGIDRIDEGLQVSDHTQEVLRNVYSLVATTLHDAIQALVKQDRARAQLVIERKLDINQQLAEARRHQARRLIVDEPKRIAAYRMEMDSLEYFRRVYYFSKRIARSVVSVNGPAAAKLSD